MLNLKIQFQLVLFISFITVGLQASAQKTKAFESEFDQIIHASVDSGWVSGVAVAVMHKGKVIYDATYGFADIGNNIPVTNEHQFQIASITKTYTAAAILRLSELGKLKLSDQVSDHLAYYVTRGHDPTIEQLLNHTSGLSEYSHHISESQHSNTRTKVLSAIQNTPPDFPLGEQMAYSNSGYYLLGLIIEQVTQMSFSDYIASEFLIPFDLVNTSYFQPNDNVKRVHGYSFIENGKFDLLPSIEPDIPYAAGNIAATSLDLLQWFSLLNTGKVINKSSYSKMTQGKSLACGHTTLYGLGLKLELDAMGRKMIRHGGGLTSGFATDVRYYPDEDLFLSVLMNTRSPAYRPEELSADLADKIAKKHPTTYEQIDLDALKLLEGMYSGFLFGKQVMIDIYIENGVLMQRQQGKQPVELGYIGNQTFKTVEADNFGDRPEYSFVETQSTKELHFTDAVNHAVLSNKTDPNILYWEIGTTKTSKVKIDGKDVRFRTRTPIINRYPGQPIVVMETGYGETINTWGRFFTEVGNFNPVITYDRAGLGESEWVDSIPTTSFEVKRLKKLLDEIDAKPPYVLVGHSYGCDLVRQFADTYPAESAGLVLIDPAKSNPQELLKAYIAIGQGRKEYDEDVERFYSEMEETPRNAALEKLERPYFESLKSLDLPEPINLPTKVLFSGLKPTERMIKETPFDLKTLVFELSNMAMQRIAKWVYRIPEGEMIIIPSSGHFIFRDEPKLTVQAVKDIVYPDIARGLQRLLDEEGIESSIKSYHKRKTYYPIEYFSETLLNQLGYKLVRSEKYQQAIAIFQLNVLEYPDEPNPHDSLGDAFRLAGKLHEAVESYATAADMAEKKNDWRAKNYRDRYQLYKDKLNHN